VMASLSSVKAAPAAKRVGSKRRVSRPVLKVTGRPKPPAAAAHRRRTLATDERKPPCGGASALSIRAAKPGALCFEHGVIMHQVRKVGNKRHHACTLPTRVTKRSR